MEINKLVPLILEFNPTLISIDLDGNDYWFVSGLLNKGVRPLIFICEYNGFSLRKFRGFKIMILATSGMEAISMVRL